MPGVDPTTDPDFMKAPPHEQMAYLTQTDHDFAKASPQDQFAYMAHIHGAKGADAELAPPAGNPASQPMNKVDALGNEQTEEEGKRAGLAGMPGPWINRPVRGRDLIPGALVGGSAAVAAAPAVVAPVARAGANLVKAHPFATMAAIEAAKQIPGVAGKIAARIPTWLPLLAGGEAEPEPEPNVAPPPLRWSTARAAAPNVAPPPLRWSTARAAAPNVAPPPLRWSTARAAAPEAEAAPVTNEPTYPPAGNAPMAGTRDVWLDRLRARADAIKAEEAAGTRAPNENLIPKLKASVKKAKAGKTAKAGD